MNNNVQKQVVLSVSQLSCRQSSQFQLENISFTIAESSCVGIIGPNGSGKTTLLKAVTGCIPTKSGHIQYCNRPIASYNQQDLSKEIAIVLQSTELDQSILVEDYILLGRNPYRKRWQFWESEHDIQFAEEAMKVTQIESLRLRKINALSGGEKQLVRIARAMAQDPRLFLLDEPTNHLDIAHQLQILTLLNRLKREKNMSIMIVLHDLNLASEFCDELILMQHGKIFTMGYAKDVLTFQNIESVYHTLVIEGENPISKKPYVFLVSEDNLKKSIAQSEELEKSDRSDRLEKSI
jgi:iron complex transport system ATP-binding protein